MPFQAENIAIITYFVTYNHIEISIWALKCVGERENLPVARPTELKLIIYD